MPRLFYILISVAVSFLLYYLLPMPRESAVVIAIAALMILLWVTEAMPMAAVALLPLVLFPLLKIATLEGTATSYANPVIFLFMGGFMLGLAIEKWNLHRRIALNIVRITGTSGDRIILGFILSTGAISMWLSNTATTMMMLPIALSVVKVLEEGHPDKKGLSNFALSVMISIALSSNFGGIATLIGTPPNVAYAAFITKQTGEGPSFLNWMLLCMPISIILLLSLYFVLKWMYPNRMKKDQGTSDLILSEITKLGPVSSGERRVMIIFCLTAFLWITRTFLTKFTGLPLDDNMIAVIGALLLFIVPSSGLKSTPLLHWEDTQKLAWGILLLFGGGIALASSLEKAGLITQMGAWMSKLPLSPLMLLALVTVVSLFISEVMSNVAQVIVFAPVVTALAQAEGFHPFYLGIPMTLAASCASMLPMGTPPNAIAFSSGYIKLKPMIRVGLVMNVIAAILIIVFGHFFIPK